MSVASPKNTTYAAQTASGPAAAAPAVGTGGLSQAGAAASVLGAISGGAGGVIANRNNKATKDALKKKLAQIQGWLTPAQEKAIEGLSDTTLLASPELTNAAADYYKNDFAAREKGSRTSGASQSVLGSATGNEALARAGAFGNAQGKSNAALTGMFTQDLGYQAGQPISLGNDPLEPLTNFLNTISSGASTAAKAGL